MLVGPEDSEIIRQLEAWDANASAKNGLTVLSESLVCANRTSRN